MTLRGRAKLQRLIADLERTLAALRALDEMEGGLARAMTRATSVKKAKPAKKAKAKAGKKRTPKGTKKVRATSKRARQVVAADVVGGRKSARKPAARPAKAKNLTKTGRAKWTKTTGAARDLSHRARYAKAPAL